MTNKLIKKVWYFDLEQFENFHSGYFIDKKGNEKVFVIHKSRNEIIKYLKFLKNEVKSLIGFNNLNYDYPLIHYMMNDLQAHSHIFNEPELINEFMVQESKKIINAEFSSIPKWKVQIPQLDIFRILHFDNPNNRCSLKTIEFVTRFKNVDDIDVGKIKRIEEKDIDKVLSYNRNDVLATKNLVESCKNDIQLREQISQMYSHYGDLDWMNFNDAKIGEEIFTYPIAKKLGVNVKELKEMRTHRSSIFLKDIILPYINFKTPEFQEVLTKFKKTNVQGTKKPFEISKIFNSVNYVYGVGGLHGSVKPSKYYSDDNYVIIEVDVASYYPNIAIKNGLYPQHLTDYFCEVYGSVYDQRVTAKKEIKKGIKINYNKLIVSVFKLALNGSFGKSNSKYSFLYDPKFTMAITVNGQLLLTMLVERLCLRINSLEMLYANTDGICFKLLREDLDKMRSICNKWEEITGLELEEDEYRGLIIRDVNNYLKIKAGENLKPSQEASNFYDNNYTIHATKGCFEVVKTKNGKISFAKNWSQIIVQKALYEYYVNGIDVRQTILNSNDILDFCLLYKNSFSPTTQSAIEGHMAYNDKLIKLNKYTRYFVSNDGGKLLKINAANPEKKDNVHKNYKCTVYNEHKENISIEDLNVNYNYYIAECNKIINVIEDNFQTKLNF
jgi:hypothetical protein